MGAMTTATSERHSRSCLMAMNAATAQAATSASPFGRVAVPMAASTPAASQCRRMSIRRQAAATATSVASEYEKLSTKDDCLATVDDDRTDQSGCGSACLRNHGGADRDERLTEVVRRHAPPP